MSKELEAGTLVVVVLKARNLHNIHTLYKQDVFAQATLNGTSKKTPVDIKGGQHPIWDVELRFPVLKQATERNRKLEISCYAQERKSDDLLGKGVIDITDTLKTGEFDEWVSLSVDGVARGDIYLEMTYFSHTPVPAPANSHGIPSPGINKRPSKFSSMEQLSGPSQQVLQGYGHQTDNRNYGQRIPSTLTGPGRRAVSSSSPPRPASAVHSKLAESPLPPLPKDNPAHPVPPGSLLPGNTQQRKDGRLREVLTDPHSFAVPNTLRPGVPNGGRKTPQRSSSGDQSSFFRGTPGAIAQEYRQSHTFAPNPPSPPSPLLSAHGRGANSNILAGCQPAATAENKWSNEGPLPPVSFPLPKAAPPDSYGSYQGPYQATLAGDLPDPYLLARYQTPLPLPLESDTGRGQAQLPTSSRDRIAPNANRVEAIRSAEEEAARRKEQTDRDLELALQLDRELNA